MAFASSWTTEKIHRVEQLLVEQKSHRAIGEMLGVTGSAITHIVSRHHLSQPRPVVAKPPKLPAAKRTARFWPDQFKNINPTLRTTSLRDLPKEDSPRAASFTECKACMWPIGNDLFCGRGKFLKSSYCWKHHLRSRREPSTLGLEPTQTLRNL
jgi:hypothetical protein